MPFLRGAEVSGGKSGLCVLMDKMKVSKTPSISNSKADLAKDCK